MKKLLEKPRLLILLLIVIYIPGLLLGAFTICAYPVYYKQKPALLRQARAIASEHLENVEDSLNYMTSSTARILIYNDKGEQLRYATLENSRPTPELDALLDRYLSCVLSGEELFKLVPAQETTRNIMHVWIMIGVPITEDGKTVGAVFLVKNLENVQEAFIGYLIYFTLFYWLTAYFFLSTVRKQKKLDELRQNYVDNITHALKSPIASVKALAETLCDGKQPDPDQQKLYYGMILWEANKQERMVRDVLALSRLQSHGMDFTKTEVSVSAVFDRLLEKYETLCDCAGISLHISDGGVRLPPLFTNEACLKQLLELLLDNAMKFVNEGGDIWVEAFPAKKLVTFCVRDNGVGITKEDLPHVFERFYKSNSRMNESGSGLGLAIAKEIMSGLNEKIWVESEPGKGSAFFFTMHTKRPGGRFLQ